MYEEMSDQEILELAEAHVAKGDIEGAEAIIKEAIHERTSVSGMGMPIHQMEAVCQFVTKAVQMAIDEIIQTAAAMQSNVVPVGFLQEIRNETPTAVTLLWKTVERLEIPLEGAAAPDDLSSLFEDEGENQ